MANYNVEDSGWRLVVHWPEEEENKERGMEKVTSSAGTNSHHSDLACVCAHAHTHTHTHTHLSVSLTPFPLCHITCSLSSADVRDEKDRRCHVQVWERIS